MEMSTEAEVAMEMGNQSNQTDVFMNLQQYRGSTGVTQECMDYMFAINVIIAIPMILFGLVSQHSWKYPLACWKQQQSLKIIEQQQS